MRASATCSAIFCIDSYLHSASPPPFQTKERSRLPVWYHDFGPCVGLTMAQTFGCEEDGSKHVDHRSSRAEQDAEHILGRCSRSCILCSNSKHRHAIVTTAIEADKQFQKKRNLPKKRGGPKLYVKRRRIASSSAIQSMMHQLA